MVDSSFVTRRLRSLVWKELADLGFESKGKKAWRVNRESVDVIDFWVVGSYDSGVLRVEPQSFRIQLGVWLDYARPSIVLAPGTTNLPDPSRPAEAACPIRRTLRSRRPAAPDASRPRFSGVEPVWSLSRDPKEIEEAISACYAALNEEALPWFRRFSDPLEVLRTLREDPEDLTETWGFGKPGSPARIELVEAVQSHLRM